MRRDVDVGALQKGMRIGHHAARGDAGERDERRILDVLVDVEERVREHRIARRVGAAIDRSPREEEVAGFGPQALFVIEPVAAEEPAAFAILIVDAFAAEDDVVPGASSAPGEGRSLKSPMVTSAGMFCALSHHTRNSERPQNRGGRRFASSVSAVSASSARMPFLPTRSAGAVGCTIGAGSCSGCGATGGNKPGLSHSTPTEAARISIDIATRLSMNPIVRSAHGDAARNFSVLLSIGQWDALLHRKSRHISQVQRSLTRYQSSAENGGSSSAHRVDGTRMIGKVKILGKLGSVLLLGWASTACAELPQIAPRRRCARSWRRPSSMKRVSRRTTRNRAARCEYQAGELPRPAGSRTRHTGIAAAHAAKGARATVRSRSAATGVAEIEWSTGQRETVRTAAAARTNRYAARAGPHHGRATARVRRQVRASGHAIRSSTIASSRSRIAGASASRVGPLRQGPSAGR